MLLLQDHQPFFEHVGGILGLRVLGQRQIVVRVRAAHLIFLAAGPDSSASP